MPYTVSYSFDVFYQNINLAGDHREKANTRRDDIVKTLGSKFYVVESFASGSIPKYTALKSHADLDVIVALHYTKHIKGKSCTEVLQSVRNALSDYANSVRRNGQAITLTYKSWPSVDIVPVARFSDSAGNFTHFEVPNSHTDVWIKSKPKEHAAAIEAKSTECGPNFRRIIKFIKEWNRCHGRYLQSYHIEVLALSVMSGSQSDLPWSIFQFFANAKGKLAYPIWYDTGFADDYLSVSDRAEAVKRFETAEDLARSAWNHTYDKNDDDKSAIGIWKRIFGDNFPAYG